MIKAICFDLDGVYFTERGKREFQKALVSLSNNEQKVEHVLYKSDEMLSFVTGKMSENDFWNHVRKYLHTTLSNSDLRDLWVKEYEIDNNVRDFVLSVKKQGYKTCTCSNNNIARVEALQEKFSFLNDFDIPIFSYQVGAVKPSKEIFSVLINEVKCLPEEIIYADDNPERLHGAQELGIQTFVYHDFEQFKAELKLKGVSL